MNENEDHGLAQLERELRSLEPLGPDPLFGARLEKGMAAAPSARPLGGSAPASSRSVLTFPTWRRWAPWAVAAAVTVVVTHPRLFHSTPEPLAGTETENSPPVQPTPKTTSIAAANANAKTAVALQPRLIPMGTDRQFRRVRDGGLQVEDNRLMRRVHLDYNNREQYRDPQNGSTLEVTFPSTEEVWVVEPVH